MTEPLRLALVRTCLPAYLYTTEEDCQRDRAQRLRHVNNILGNSSLQGAGPFQLNHFSGTALDSRKARVNQLIQELEQVPGLDSNTFGAVLHVLAGLTDAASAAVPPPPHIAMQAAQMQQPWQPPKDQSARKPSKRPATPQQILPALRAVLAACRGIKQHPVDFDLANLDGDYTVHQEEGYHMSRPQQRVLEQTCRLGSFFRRIQVFIDQGRHQPLDAVGSAVLVAFRGALSVKLVEALQLLSSLQARATPSVTGVSGASTGVLTYMQLYTELQPLTLDLRFVASAVQNVAQTQQGGVVLGQLYTHTEHGNTHIHQLMMSLLEPAALPLLRSLHAWAFEGKLQGAPGDVFISETSSKEMWGGRFQILDSVRPHFISQDLAATILRCGKGLVFLREYCGEEEWAAAFEGSNEAIAAQNLNVAQMDELQQVYEGAAARVDQHLLKILTTKFSYKEHLLAVKRYILLSQGDFRHELIKNVTVQLERTAGQVNRTHLSRALYDAVQHSLARFDGVQPADRLVFNLAPTHKHARGAESGWDIISLHLRLAEPLATLMPAAIASGYGQLQQLLLRIELGQDALCKARLHFRDSQRSLDAISKLCKAHGTTVPGIALVGSALTLAQVLRSTMSSFMQAYQSYIKLEVVEHSSNEFLNSLADTGNLDALIALHGEHVEGMLHKALLKESVQYNLRSLMFLMRGLQAVSEELSHQVSGAVRELQERLAERRKKTSEGQWAIELAAPMLKGIERGPIAGIQASLDTLEKDFHEGEASLVAQMKSDIDLEYLLFSLNSRHEGTTPSRNTTPRGSATPRGK